MKLRSLSSNSRFFKIGDKLLLNKSDSTISLLFFFAEYIYRLIFYIFRACFKVNLKVKPLFSVGKRARERERERERERDFLGFGGFLILFSL